MSEKRVISLEWDGSSYSESIDGEFELKLLTPVEVRQALNKAVGQYTYYSGVLADALRMQKAIDDDFDVWHSEKYLRYDEEAPKKTEGWKKSMVMVDFKKEWKEWKERQRSIAHVIDKLKAIVRGYEKQMGVLQTISAMQRVELEKSMYSSGDIPDAKGSRDLHDDDF